MSTQTFHLPDVGEGLTEAEIVQWRVAPGDDVAVNDVLVEIETAKSLVELPAPYAGRVAALLVAEGDVVGVGSPILVIDDGTESLGPVPLTELVEPAAVEPAAVAPVQAAAPAAAETVAVVPVESAELAKVPSTFIKLEGKQAEQMLKLVDKLEELDDIQNVWANFDISDEGIEKFSKE